jgi:Flp pilus assembly protein TadB
MRRLRWEAPRRPVPRHPYRDTAILYAVLAGLVIGVTALTGGDLRRAVIVACLLFVGATAYSWWRWHSRIRERADEE